MMTTNRPYGIETNSLTEGVHTFQFRLDDAFFRSIEQEEILGGEVAANARLTLLSGGEGMLAIEVKGRVSVVCDRCLDPMDTEVAGADMLPVRTAGGQNNGTAEAEDALYTEAESGYLDLSWILYELIETNLPIVHSHQSGECNPQMEELLQSHLCTTEEDPEDNI